MTHDRNRPRGRGRRIASATGPQPVWAMKRIERGLTMKLENLAGRFGSFWGLQW